MKNFKKTIALVLAFVLTIVASVGATVAWLTAEAEPKTNVFTVGSVEIALDEEVGVIGEGATVTENEDGATYDGAMPGDYLIKKPTVTNTGEKAAYVAITVTLNNADAINAAIDEVYENAPYNYSEEQIQAIYDEVFPGWGINYNPRPGAAGINDARGVIDGTYGLPENVLKVDFTKKLDDYWMYSSTNWFIAGVEKPGQYIITGYDSIDGYYAKNMEGLTDHIRYTYYAYLEPDESVTVFEGLNVPADFNADQLAMFKDLTIKIEASAIQADNFDIPQVAFAELAGTEWTASTITPDTSWYNDTDSTFTLTTREELAGLAELVNGGNNFAQKTIVLGDNMDLAYAEWTPIGSNGKGFNGTFDGNGKTVSNLYISGYNSTVGLFGNTYNGEIKNLTVDNAVVSGRLNVGVVAGNPYTSKYTNITVTGDVQVEGMAYVGAVGGKNAYTDWTDITVNVDAGSYVKANSVENGTAYRTYVGGVVGFMGEGGHTMSNVTSNIDVIGSTCDVGGLVGIAHYGNSFVNCSSSGNVTITDAEEAADAEQIGGLAGVWHNGGSDVTFTGCSFTGKLITNITEGVDLSDNTIVGAAYNTTGTGNLVIN